MTQLTTYWSNAHDYHTVELEFDGDKIVFKDWRDHGHDPNRTEVPAHEFLAGALHDEIRTELGQAVHDETLESVQLLTPGGPGVAESPE